jgi:hypothetical protein
MAVHINIPASAIALARDISGLTAEEAADLAEKSEAAVVIGIFSVGLHFACERWVHLLRGEPVEDASEGVSIFQFESSMASFRVKQVLRRRQREKDAGARLAKRCPNCGHRITTAAEQPRSLSDV